MMQIIFDSEGSMSKFTLQQKNKKKRGRKHENKTQTKMRER